MRSFLASGLLVVACGSSTSPTDGGSPDAPFDGSKNPCEGLGCASFPGTLTLHVLDTSTMTSIDGPTFKENAQKLTPTCKSPDAGADGGSSCSAWEFPGLGIGSHSIVVEAFGYQPGWALADIRGPSGCCGKGADVDLNVLLMK